MRIRRWRLPMAILAAIGVCPLWVTRANAQGPNIAVNANGATMCIVRGDSPANEKVDQNGNGSSNTLYSYVNVRVSQVPPVITAPPIDDEVPVDNWVPFNVEYGGSWPRSIKGQFSMPSHYLWTPNESQDNWRTGILETHPAASFSEINGTPKPFPITATSGDKKWPQTQTYAATPPGGTTKLTSTYTLELHDPVEFVGPAPTPNYAYIYAIIDVALPQENNSNEPHLAKFDFSTQIAQRFDVQIEGAMLKLTGSTAFTLGATTELWTTLPPHEVEVPQVVIRCNHSVTPVMDWDVAGNHTPDTEVTNTLPCEISCRWSDPYLPGKKPTTVQR